MVKLRMQRHGRSHRPFYRIVAVDARFKRNGKYLERLGWFNPTPGEGEESVEINTDRVKHWLSVGAQPSDTVRDLLAERDLLTPKLAKQREMDRKMDNARREKREAAAKAAEEAKAAAEAAAAKAAEEAAAKKAAEEAAAAETSAETPAE
ncbi:MAG: 30S ribosomal protein S16 [Phycisphaerales bacterium]|nr:30S ribosomal protein S16 [Phycisphaerales bacterium]MCB9836883.1 30S ribosomal protein S16 [Phycisphaera sp.]